MVLNSFHIYWKSAFFITTFSYYSNNACHEKSIQQICTFYHLRFSSYKIKWHTHKSDGKLKSNMLIKWPQLLTSLSADIRSTDTTREQFKRSLKIWLFECAYGRRRVWETVQSEDAPKKWTYLLTYSQLCNYLPYCNQQWQYFHQVSKWQDLPFELHQLWLCQEDRMGRQSLHNDILIP